MQTNSTATTQRQLFSEPPSAIDQIRELWTQVSEPERVAFIDEVRRAFLFRNKPSPAVPDGQRRRGVK